MPSERAKTPPKRVTLEERLAWLERHVTEQDKAMLGLHEDVACLRAELKQLRERSVGGGNNEMDDAGDKPPHY